MGLETFRVNIMDTPVVQSRVVDGLLLLIEKERSGDAVDRGLVKTLLRMLSALQIYNKVIISVFFQYLSCGKVYFKLMVRLNELQ